MTSPHSTLSMALMVACLATTGCRRGPVTTDEADNIENADPEDTGNTDDTDNEVPFTDPVSELPTSVWTATSIGSLGTYVTWFEFRPAILDITYEIQDGWENGVQWTSDGTWTSPVHGIATLHWGEKNSWDDGIVEHDRHWTYAPVSASLTLKAYEDWERPETTSWSTGAVLATDASHTAFHGEWIFDHDLGYPYEHHQSVDVQFDGPIQAGSPCQVMVSMMYSRLGQNNTVLEASDSFDWSCTVTDDAETGLTHVAIDDFSGTVHEIGTQWRDLLRNQYEPVQHDFEQMFFPDLWLDPTNPSVLAFRTNAPLLVQEGGAAPDE